MIKVGKNLTHTNKIDQILKKKKQFWNRCKKTNIKKRDFVWNKLRPHIGEILEKSFDYEYFIKSDIFQEVDSNPLIEF